MQRVGQISLFRPCSPYGGMVLAQTTAQAMTGLVFASAFTLLELTLRDSAARLPMPATKEEYARCTHTHRGVRGLPNLELALLSAFGMVMEYVDATNHNPEFLIPAPDHSSYHDQLRPLVYRAVQSYCEWDQEFDHQVEVASPGSRDVSNPGYISPLVRVGDWPKRFNFPA